MLRYWRGRSHGGGQLFRGGSSLWKAKGMGHQCMPQQCMIGSYQCISEFHRDDSYGGLTGGEEVELTLTLLHDSLFLQALDGLSMQLLKWVCLRGSLSLCVFDGPGTKVFSFLYRAGTGGLGFLDGCEAENFGFLGRTGADNLGLPDGFCCFGLVLAKSHAKLPN